MIRDLEDKSLAGRNSFGVQASCRQFIEYETTEDLRTVFADMICRHEKWMVLSGGNNVLFTADYDGVILHPVSDGIEITAQMPTIRWYGHRPASSGTTSWHGAWSMNSGVRRTSR